MVCFYAGVPGYDLSQFTVAGRERDNDSASASDHSEDDELPDSAEIPTYDDLPDSDLIGSKRTGANRTDSDPDPDYQVAGVFYVWICDMCRAL